MRKIKLLLVAVMAMFSSGLWADNMTTTNYGTTVPATSNAFALDAGFYYRMICYSVTGANSWETSTANAHALFYEASSGKIGEAVLDGTNTNLTQLWDITLASGSSYNIKNLSQGKYVLMDNSANSKLLALSVSATDAFNILPFSGTTTRTISTGNTFNFWSITDAAMTTTNNGFNLSRTAGNNNGYWQDYSLNTASATINHNIAITFSKVSKSTVDTYHKNQLGANLTLGNSLVAGTIPETAPLGYSAGAKTTLQSAITTAQGVYDNVASTAYEYSSASTTLTNAIAAFDAAKIAISSVNYNVKVGSDYLIAGATPSTTSDQSSSTIFTIATDGTGHCTLMNGTNYLQPDGTLTTTSVAYRFVVDGTTLKLNVVSAPTTYLTAVSSSIFSLADVVTAVKPALVSYTPSAATDVVTPTTVSITYNQNIQIANASGITVNGTVTAATISGHVLTLTITPTIKTTYAVAISASAIAHADNASLTADAVSYTFTTYSPYLRDKQTMLGSGTFSDGKSYAWFSYGDNAGYLRGGQLACSTSDVLSNTLDNSDYSFWIPVLTDAANKVWAIKNFKTNKYLGYDATSKSLTVSETPVSWQISLVDNASSTYNYQKYYAIWPSVTDADPIYDYALKPSTTTIAISVANGTVPSSAFALCPMLSPVDYANTQVYSEAYYVTLNARAGGQFYQNGTTLAFGTPSPTESGQWKYKRLSNGQYTFQNRVTGDFITYVDDATVSVLPTGSAGNKEWGIMYNATATTTDWYTIWGTKKALYGNGGAVVASLGTSNGSNSANSAYMLRPIITAVAYSAWNGTGNWSSSANWSNTALPGTNSDILIQSGNVSLDQDQDASGSVLRIYSGAQLTVNAGKKLTIGASTFANNGTFTLESNENGTATFVNTDATAKSISATVNQYLPSARNWYITIPTTTTTVPTGSTYYYYDETQLIADADHWIPVTEGSSLSVGQGYIAQPGAATTLVYNGTLNDGDVPVSLTRSDVPSKAGFNLVGNPYPSYLNWKTCYDDADNALNANVDPTIWYRTKNSSGVYKFGTYGAVSNLGTNIENDGLPVDIMTGNIPSMQAFWVRVNAGKTTGTLTFKNSMRAHKGVQVQGDGQTYDDSKLRAPSTKNMTQQVLRLQVSNGINNDETIVLFNANASNGLDAYDSPKMSNANAAIPEIYTVAGTEKMVINGLNSPTPDLILPLGFTAGESNSFTIKATQITNFDGLKVYLKDSILNTEQELTDTSSYNFTSDVASTSTRFSVVFKSAGVTTDFNTTIDQAVVINKNANNQITVNCKGAINNDFFVSVYNALGQKVSAQQIITNNTIICNRFTPGVYAVIVNNGNKRTTKKLILN